jgi:hypothetical protein
MFEAEVRAVERCFGRGAFFSARREMSWSDALLGQILGPTRKGVSTVYARGVTIKTAPGW